MNSNIFYEVFGISNFDVENCLKKIKCGKIRKIFFKFDVESKVISSIIVLKFKQLNFKNFEIFLMNLKQNPHIKI